MRLANPINQYIRWSLSNAPNRLRIIGVVKNALTNAPFAPAEPTIFVYQPWTFTIMYRLAPNVSTQTALAALKPIFSKYNPDYPFEYHFVDENYAAHFELEMLIGKLAGIFAALAIELRRSFVPRSFLVRNLRFPRLSPASASSVLPPTSPNSAPRRSVYVKCSAPPSRRSSSC